MPRDGDDGAAMAFSRREAVIEKIDVSAPIRLDPHGAGGGLDEAPFQIVVDIAAGAAMPDAASAGYDAGHQTGVAGEVLRSREAFDLADLKPDEGGEDLADAGHGAEQPDLWRRLEGGRDALLDPFDLDFKLGRAR